MARFLLGVDEAGRGPLAGPVAVGVVIAPEWLDIPSLFPGVADSKKLSEKKREEIFSLLEGASEAGFVRYHVAFASAQDIDTKGITKAVRACVAEGVRALAPDPESHTVLLDGLLSAPAEYEQQTIIHGDATTPIISLASIAAKVLRDRLMIKLAGEYPQYGFEVHKGYGTAKHLAALQKYGLCALHRTTFTHITHT